MRMLACPSSPRRSSSVDIDAPELAAVDVRNAVVAGQTLIDKGVIGGQQIHHAAVFAHDAGKKSLVSSLMAWRRLSSKSGNASRLGAEFFRLRRKSHCSAKLSTRASDRWIGQHALHLLLQDGGLVQFPLAGKIQQVGRRECCSTRRRTGAKPAPDRPSDTSASRGDIGRIGLKAEQELRDWPE